jgi:hypothetical protein
MIYQFERGEIETCASCPCWCPDIISKGYATDDGCCYVNYEERHRHTPKPDDCPLVAISKTETTSCEWCEGNVSKYFDVNWYDFNGHERLDKSNYCPACGRKLN